MPRTKRRSSALYLTKFSVSGDGAFPFRLLAAEHCYPIGPKDAEAMAFQPCEMLHPVRVVNLIKVGVAAAIEPVTAAWHVVGWLIDPKSVQEV